MSVINCIWDFDGTLFDTYPYICAALTEALRGYGFDADRTEMMYHMLETIGNANDFFADRFGINRQELAGRVSDIRKRCGLLAEPFDGAKEALESVINHGGRNFMFSHSSKGTIGEYFDRHGLSPLFTEIVTCRDNGFAYKPSPDAINYLIDAYSMDKQTTVMIGDRDLDLASGRNAGVLTCHFPCPIAPQILRADFVLTSLYAINDVLDKLSAR